MIHHCKTFSQNDLSPSFTCCCCGHGFVWITSCHALRSLELNNAMPNSVPLRNDSNWQIFRTLAHELIDDLFPAFLDQHSVHLAELSIIPWGKLDDLAERFYASALQKHIGTLDLFNISSLQIVFSSPRLFSLLASQATTLLDSVILLIIHSWHMNQGLVCTNTAWPMLYVI